MKNRGARLDLETISAYDSAAAEIAELHKGLVPIQIYALVQRYFRCGGGSVDIGSGIGRDTAWLADHGFKTIGVEPSFGMLEQAQSLFQSIEFIQDGLPSLSKLEDGLYDNVLCSAVIMHLGKNQIPDAARNLIRITRPDGVIILSYRGTENADQRENGKLYTLLDKEELQQIFSTAGALLLHLEVNKEEARGLNWTTLVFKKLQSLAV